MRTGCKHHGDCFTCPYPDCILNELEAAQQDAIDGINQEKKRSPKYEYNHRRYMARRESEKEKQKIYRERRKDHCRDRKKPEAFLCAGKG